MAGKKQGGTNHENYRHQLAHLGECKKGTWKKRYFEKTTGLNKWNHLKQPDVDFKHVASRHFITGNSDLLLLRLFEG